MKRIALSEPLHLSISTRLTLWYGLTLVLLLSLFALFSYLSFHVSMHSDFDRHLAHEQRELLPLVHLENGRPAFGSLHEVRSVAYQTDGVFGTYVRLLTPSGEVLYESPNFQNHVALPVLLPETIREAKVSRDWEAKPARTLYTPLVDASDVLQGWIEVTGFEWSLHRELAWMGRALAVGVLLSLLLSVGGGYLLARRALRPVVALTGAAHRIGATNLSERLPTRFGVRDELTELAETFNGMIARLEASFDRERRFTANAAHELLTPMATMRNEIEVALRRRRPVEGYEETLQRMLVDVEEMSTMVRELLELSHAERLREAQREPVDLGELARKHVGRTQARAEARGVQLQLTAPDAAFVQANAGRLGEVLDNLLDNALKYTPEDGCVLVSVRKDSGSVHLSVQDTGVGFDPEVADQLFDRFYRADTPEVQAQSGSGLGLSIVAAIVEAYGGSVRARSEGLHQGSTFEFTLPRMEPVPQKDLAAAAVPRYQTERPLSLQQG